MKSQEQNLQNLANRAARNPAALSLLLELAAAIARIAENPPEADQLPYSESAPTPAPTPLPAPSKRDSDKPAKSFCLDIGEVAAVFAISTRTVERWIDDGKIPPPLKLGRRRLWHPDVISAALRDRQQDTPPVDDIIERYSPTGRGADEASHN